MRTERSAVPRVSSSAFLIALSFVAFFGIVESAISHDLTVTSDPSGAAIWHGPSKSELRWSGRSTPYTFKARSIKELDQYRYIQVKKALHADSAAVYCPLTPGSNSTHIKLKSGGFYTKVPTPIATPRPPSYQRPSPNRVPRPIQSTPVPQPSISQDPLAILKVRSATRVYETSVRDSDSDILQLANGAILKSDHIGYIGHGSEAFLFGGRFSVKLWIEGEGEVDCEVIRGPSGTWRGGEILYISDVEGDGAVISMMDGSIYVVDELDRIDTGLWLGASEALLIDGRELINLEEDDEPVKVSRIR